MTTETRDLESYLGNNALSVLVSQFSNRFDFVRELVQNSLDSGTAEVDVWTAFHEGKESGDGVCEIHVDDNGCGMDEQVIDKCLTRLFASSKEGDLTSIGKFGIGFVSVFAPEPDGVLLKTAKGGERWEVFFDRARNVEKTRIDDAVEGTKITIFKSMSEAEYIETVETVFSMLKFWCRFAEKKIWFRDTAKKFSPSTADPNIAQAPARRQRRREDRILVNEEMTVTGDFPVQVKRGEAEIALAFCDSPQYGFYNRGLTLKETDRPDLLIWARTFFENVSFRIKSPHLEHTLTRDTILMDNNYQKALLTLVDATRLDLVENLLSTLEKLATEGPTNGRMPDAYMQGLNILFSLKRELDPVFTVSEAMADKMDTTLESVTRACAALFHVDRTPLPDQKSVNARARKIFRRCHGGPCTLDDIQRTAENTEGRVILSDAENEMTKELLDFEKPAFFAPTTSESVDFFTAKMDGKIKEVPQGKQTVFIVGTHTWLAERLNRTDLNAVENACFEQLESLARPAGLSLVPVNFLGDNPMHLVLGGALTGRIAFKVSTTAGVRGEAAIDVKGQMFQKLAAMTANEQERDLATLLAADEMSRWFGLNEIGELAVLSASKERIS